MGDTGSAPDRVVSGTDRGQATIPGSKMARLGHGRSRSGETKEPGREGREGGGGGAKPQRQALSQKASEAGLRGERANLSSSAPAKEKLKVKTE